MIFFSSISSQSDAAEVTLTGGGFTSCSSTYVGGGLYTFSKADVTASDTFFDSCYAYYGGGAIAMYGTSNSDPNTAILNSVEFKNNTGPSTVGG